MKNKPIARPRLRELEVFALWLQLFTYKEIGKQLFISPLTVKTHKQNLVSRFLMVEKISYRYGPDALSFEVRRTVKLVPNPEEYTSEQLELNFLE